MSAGLAASTVTPGSAPPVASLTTPAIALCADARPTMSASADITSTAVIKLRMYVLQSFTLRDLVGRHRAQPVPWRRRDAEQMLHEEVEPLAVAVRRGRIVAAARRMV